jgi:hypothetical protein
VEHLSWGSTLTGLLSVEYCQWVGKLGTLEQRQRRFEHSLLPLKNRGTRTAAEVKKTKFEHSLLSLKYRGTRAAAVVEKTKFE